MVCTALATGYAANTAPECGGTAGAQYPRWQIIAEASSSCLAQSYSFVEVVACVQTFSNQFGVTVYMKHVAQINECSPVPASRWRRFAMAESKPVGLLATDTGV